MSIRTFIKLHRAEITAYVLSRPGMKGVKLNDNDRREWILSDEPLYRWARSEGCKI